MWNTILLTMAIVALAFILLGIKVIFVKGGKFPNTHIGANKEMKKEVFHAHYQPTLSIVAGSNWQTY